MPDISNKAFITLMGVALFVSVIGMFGTGNNFLNLAGFATTGTGQTRINVTPLIALNLTNIVIDFGNGTVATNALNCTISSDRIGLNGTNPAKCFPASAGMGATGAARGGFSMENIGNVMINVTVKATKNGTRKDGNSFWGVKSQGGLYKYRCRGNGTTQISAFTNVFNNTKSCQTNVPVYPSSRFVLDINLTIPKNATGLKNDTLTFTASRACESAC